MIDYGLEVKLGTIDDYMFLQNKRNDFRIRRWCRQVGLINQKMQHAWGEKKDLDPTIEMFKIESIGGSIYGVCGLTDIDLVHKRAEFSLYVFPEYQGNGYAHAALLTLFSYGFEELGLNRIWGECFDKNPAMKLFKKIGMDHEGKRNEFYFKNGRFIDAHLVSIKHSDFFLKYPNLVEGQK